MNRRHENFEFQTVGARAASFRVGEVDMKVSSNFSPLERSETSMSEAIGQSESDVLRPEPVLHERLDMISEINSCQTGSR